ncbi:MAG: DUF448 domain-containing protein [Synergistaceae bacterium]|nr:DUF448 domain-containing protein [Synergistaceae bacterium]
MKNEKKLTPHSSLLTKKHVPTRSCSVCKVKSDKNDLIRLVKSPDGKIFIDSSKKLPGRGAYICPDLECLERAKETGILANVLKAEIDDNFWPELEEYIKNFGENINLKIKSVLGLARKAGALLIGSEKIENEGHKKILVILAEDSSEGVKKFAEKHQSLSLGMTIKELSEVTGLRDSVQILGLPLNSGFAKKIINLYNSEHKED